MATTDEANKRTWPAGPFYILVGNGYSFQALTSSALVEDTSARKVIADILLPIAEQLWVAVELPTFSDEPANAILLNVGTQAPAVYNNYDGTESVLLTVNNGTRYPAQIWKLDQGRISPASYPNSYIRRGISTDGAVTIGEAEEGFVTTFTFLLEEGSYTELTQTAHNYFPAPIEIIGFAGGEGRNVLVDNSASKVDFTGQVELSFTTETSTTYSQGSSHTDTTSKSITASLSAGGTFAKILKINAGLSTTYTTETSDAVSISTDKTQSQSKTYSITCVTDVPAGRKYRFLVQPETKAFQSPYSIPIYINSSLPGAAPYAALLTGTYFGANATASQIVVTDVSSTNPAEHVEVSRTFLPL